MQLDSTVRIVLGVSTGALVSAGILGLLVGMGSLIDPNIQMSNDADPFAAPPTRESSLMLTVASACALLLGGGLAVWLARRS